MRMSFQRVYAEDGVSPAVCFLQGCAGDLTHRIARDRQAWPRHFGQHTPAQALIMGRLSAAAAVLASEHSIEVEAEIAQAAVQPLELPFRDGSGSEVTELQVVRIGPHPSGLDSDREAIWLVGLPGEPFSRYGVDMGRSFHGRLGALADRVLVCGYTNDCVGYLCTPNALQEGGYEADRAHQVYHRPSPFCADSEEVVLDRALTAAERLAKKRPAPPRMILMAVPQIVRRWLSLRG